MSSLVFIGGRLRRFTLLSRWCVALSLFASKREKGDAYTAQVQMLGKDPEKVYFIECTEKQDGTWEKGAKVEGNDAKTLEEVGWDETRDTTNGVWLVMVGKD